jgi:hypothetical protein
MSATGVIEIHAGRPYDVSAYDVTATVCGPVMTVRYAAR